MVYRPHTSGPGAKWQAKGVAIAKIPFFRVPRVIAPEISKDSRRCIPADERISAAGGSCGGGTAGVVLLATKEFKTKSNDHQEGCVG